MITFNSISILSWTDQGCLILVKSSISVLSYVDRALLFSQTQDHLDFVLYCLLGFIRFFFSLSCAAAYEWPVPWPGLNLCPLCGKHGCPTSGLPGSPLQFSIFTFRTMIQLGWLLKSIWSMSWFWLFWYMNVSNLSLCGRLLAVVLVFSFKDHWLRVCRSISGFSVLCHWSYLFFLQNHIVLIIVDL